MGLAAHPRLRLAAVGAVVVASLLPVQSARADRFDPTRPEVITLEPRSRDPRAVVLADGTTVVQWYHDEGNITGGSSAVVSCRIPKGASGCDAPPTTMLGGTPRTSSELVQPDPADDPDHVYSLTSRLETPGMVHWVRESTDGGRTWSSAVKGATNTGQQLGAIRFLHGPGVFGFSSLADGWFEAGTYDGSSLSTIPTRLQPSFAPSSTVFWQGLGRAESTTPVVGFLADQYDGAGRRLSTRKFTGSGNVNAGASWSAVNTYAPPRGMSGMVGFASGLRGLFAAFFQAERDGCGQRLVVARYDGTTFGTPVPVDADPHAADIGTDCSYGNENAPGEPVAFTQDPGGNLRAVWTFNRRGADPTAPDGLYTALSVDGGLTWTNPIRLYDYADGAARSTLPNTNGTSIASNEAGDAVVLGSGSGTQDRGVQLMRLPSIAAALAQPGPAPPGASPPPPPPAPPEPAACARVKFGAVNALATVGCWKKKGSTYTSSGPVRINGIDLKPLTGSGARATFAQASVSTVALRADRRAIRAARRADPTEIVIDQAASTIRTTGAWRAGASAVDLGRQAINWYVPPKGGAVLDAATRELARLDASQITQRVLGLPASGMVLPKFLTDGTAQLPMNLQLPPPLGGLAGGPLTDNVVLSTANGVGIQLSRGAISLELPKVSLGIAEIDPFKVTYNADPFVFQGAVGIKLPVIGGGIDASLLIQDGEFVDATASYTPTPPIPITGFVYLTRVGLHVFKGRSCDQPTGLEISARVSAGPEIAGTSLLAIDGTAGYKLPEASCNRPGVFFINGKGSLVSIPVATVYVQFTTDGVVTFGAAIVLGSDATNVSGSIDGGISFGTGDFFAKGAFGIRVLGFKAASAEAIVSSYGLGVCAELQPIPIPGLSALTSIDGGVAVRFQDTPEYEAGVTFYPLDCYIDDLEPVVFAKKFQDGTAGVGTAQVAAGAKRQTFVAKSADGQPAPRFTLIGPGGERYPSGEAQGLSTPAPGVVAHVDDGIHQSAISVTKPARGTWRIEPQPGSSAITSAESAQGGDKPEVTAAVKRFGGARGAFALDYRASLPSGAKLTFFDDTGARVGNPTTAERGTVRFTSNTGKAGRRGIVARIEGVAGPMAAPTVAHFQAPGAPKAGKPRSVRLMRGKRGTAPGLKVSWKPAAGAAKYVVRAELRDGRRLELEVKGSKRSATIPAVPGFAAATVRVYAVAKDGRAGSPAIAKAKAIKAKPKKRAAKR